MLLNIARAHVKLAMEYSNTNTLPCWREAIKAEIQRLRIERDEILERIVSTNDHQLQTKSKDVTEHVGNPERTRKKERR